MMKTITLYILSLFLLIPLLGYTQGQSNNWYFGQNAGVTFNSGSPQPLTDGALISSEGTATLSDSQGNLLFYVGSSSSDSEDPQAHVLTVWNRNHQAMPNGTNLYGSSTSSQAAIIIPNPENNDLYYIFSTDGLFEGENDTDDLEGFNYTTVNMTLNDGLGDVLLAEKNVNLLPTSSEKITAVRSTDCNGIWVITHFVDTFYAYLVDGGGVNNVPVTSVVLPNVPLNGYRDNAMGYLQISPDGTKLAIAHTTLSNDPGEDPQSPGALWLYDFDPATGMVSNGMELEINMLSPYGVAFSPDSSKLYASLNAYSGIPFDHSELYQYDLNAVDISGSLTVINNSNTPHGALQLGPDSRIYRAVQGNSFLDVINNPNIAGPGSNYNSAAISLNGRSGLLGLPPFTPSLFNETIDIVDGPAGEFITEVMICEGGTYTLTAQNIAGADYEWARNGAVLAEVDFDLEVSLEGVYTVEIDLNDGSCPLVGEATVTVDDAPVANDITISQCDDLPSDGFSVFYLTDAIPEITGNAIGVSVSFYETLMDAEGNNNPLNPGNYVNTVVDMQTIYARVNNNTGMGCFSIAEVTLQVDFNFVLSGSLTSCSNDGFAPFTLSDADEQVLFLVGGPGGAYTVSYYLNQDDAFRQVNQLDNNYVNEDEFSQEIIARVENEGNCYGISSVFLIVNAPPGIAEDEEILYCLNDPAPINLSSGFLVGSEFDYTFEWSTGEITESISVNIAGVYEVTITDFEGCSVSRTITVIGSDVAVFESIDVADFSDNNTITVNVIGDGDYEFSLNSDTGPYQDSNIFNNVPPGTHIVYVRDKNDCGISQQEVIVIGYPKFFTPNADGVNDTWQLSVNDELFQPNSRIFIFDRYGKLITELSPSSSWDGNYNGNPLPSSDYWFSIQLEDGRVFKGHFTLKR